jgi:phosphoglycerate dehydrogenase-like enzyme
MTVRVRLSGDYDDDWVHGLQSKLAKNISLTVGEGSAQNHHVLVSGRPAREELAASSEMHSLIIPWAGLPVATRTLMLEFEHIAVYNLHHNATATAEMAIALMMTAAKHIIPIDRDLRNNNWTPRYTESKSISLASKTALILGYGAIGSRVALACRSLGMHVHAIKNNVGSETDEVAQIHPRDELLNLLPRANVLFICLPLTPTTENLITAKDLSRLPDSAILINVARGKIVDESALYRALKEGRIRAGLDVWYNYPPDSGSRTHTPPSNHAFGELDNVVMTPHLAGHTHDIETRRRAALAELLNTLASGNVPSRSVCVAQGY